MALVDVCAQTPIDGFTLDRGFQVFLTAYPEYAGCLDLDQLQLRNFWPGAIVQLGDGRSTLVADPTRSSVSTLLPTLTTPLGTIADKLRLGIAVLRLKFLTSISAIFERDEVSTDEHLRSRLQLSDGIVHSFFRPFFCGIFLAPLAKQSSILFEFILRMFLDGSAALPDNGMGSVPAQLARNVVASGGTIECGTAIDAIKLGAPHELQTADGRTITCDRLVLATPRREADRLLGETDAAGGEREEELYTSTALYFALDGPPPVSEPLLVLNGQTEGLLNNVCFPSTVSASYARQIARVRHCDWRAFRSAQAGQWRCGGPRGARAYGVERMVWQCGGRDVAASPHVYDTWRADWALSRPRRLQ